MNRLRRVDYRLYWEEDCRRRKEDYRRKAEDRRRRVEDRRRGEEDYRRNEQDSQDQEEKSLALQLGTAERFSRGKLVTQLVSIK